METTDTRAHTAGFSLLELEVALVLLGVALAGLFPLVAVHSRGLRKLEGRVLPPSNACLVPSADAWARKLGAAARLTASTSPLDEPGQSASQPANNVQVLSFDRSLSSEEVTACVTVNPVEPP